ncbi:MAG: hypothetical protein GY822_03470 [Deltaproteobacteria bacterium]|nr:hypothetical protein [Deltaproteobacteria bacterium]
MLSKTILVSYACQFLKTADKWNDSSQKGGERALQDIEAELERQTVDAGKVKVNAFYKMKT